MLKQLTKDEMGYISGGIDYVMITSLVVNFAKTQYNGSCAMDKLKREQKTWIGCQLINTVIPAIASYATKYVVDGLHHHPQHN